jgi:hypothetical protein
MSTSLSLEGKRGIAEVLSEQGAEFFITYLNEK